MNDTTKASANAFSVTFVQSDYFLCRIQQLEEKYRDTWQSWGEFLADYSTGAAKVDRDNSDLDEWAFLCNHFQEQLLRSNCDVGPPERTMYSSQKPETDSGFCFVENYCSTGRIISIPFCEQLKPATRTRKLAAPAWWLRTIGIVGGLFRGKRSSLLARVRLWMHLSSTTKES